MLFWYSSFHFISSFNLARNTNIDTGIYLFSFSLRKFFQSYCIELEANVVHNSYLHLDELLIEDVVWVDEVNGLLEATSYFEDCKIIGIDCEWKPNYEKGSQPSKVPSVYPLPLL